MENIIDINDLGINNNKKFGSELSKFMMKFLKFNAINQLVKDANDDSLVEFSRYMLGKIDVEVDCSENNVSNIPKKGGFVAVANFPHGILDCLAVLHVLGNVRNDIKFFVGGDLAKLPVLKKFIVGASANSTIEMAREAVRHVQNGGVLVIFPAGRVAGISASLLHSVEKPWKLATLSKIAKITKTPLVPIYISGSATKTLRIVNKIFPWAEGLWLVRELLKNKSTDVDVVIAKSIYYSDIITLSRASKFNVAQQDLIVGDTLRATLFLQAIKLNDPYNAIKEETPNYFEQDVVIDGFEEQSHTPIAEIGQSKLYLTNDMIVVYKGNKVLFSANYFKYDFRNFKSIAGMRSLEDFEFNQRKISKTIPSCIELINVKINYGLVDSSKQVLEDFLRIGIKHLEVDSFMVNVRHKQKIQNLVTSVFNKFIESYHIKGVMKHSILSRGNFYQGYYIGHTLKNESKHFYSPALFARYASDIEYLDVSKELLVFFNIGARMGGVSGRNVNNESEHSFLLIFQ